MKVAVFSAKSYDKKFMEEANKKLNFNIELAFFETRLKPKTASLAEGYDAVSVFVNDDLCGEVLEILKKSGIKLAALRSAGYNNVDLKKAAELGITVIHVPAYSPYAVAEHAASLIMALNRKIHKAYPRVRDGNFALDGLMGFDIRNKMIGVIGTGKIGEIFTRIMKGFGCGIFAYDKYENEDCKNNGVMYRPLEEVLAKSDIISLHCPLLPETRHIINEKTIAMMKNDVMIINTSRGALIDTQAVINGLKSKKIGYLGLDVYEEEANLFFRDLSNEVIQDDVFMRLLSFPNVIVTAHQGFFTDEALRNIAETTLSGMHCFGLGHDCKNIVKLK